MQATDSISAHSYSDPISSISSGSQDKVKDLNGLILHRPMYHIRNAPMILSL